MPHEDMGEFQFKGSVGCFLFVFYMDTSSQDLCVTLTNSVGKLCSLLSDISMQKQTL